MQFQKMNKFIILLKGINVGGHKKVPMAELRTLLTKNGFENVQTYIQSGNIILNTSNNRKNTETLIFKTIKNHFSFESLVLAQSRESLNRIFESCPFTEEKRKSSYFIMLHDIPSEELIKIASEKQYEGEEYKIINDCIYYYSSKGFGQAKFNANFFERKLKTFATARNYNTMVKLLSLSAD